MTDTKDAPHPSNITEEQREELRKSDPAAFDEEAPADKADAEQAEADRLAAEKAEADRIAAETAATDKKPDYIPKARLNEVLGERDRERERADALAAELTALKAGPPVDYDEEISSLQQQWDNDEFEGSHADFLSKRDGLIAARAEAGAIARYEQQKAAEAAQASANQWAADAAAFVKANPAYDANSEDYDAEDHAALESALHGVFAKYPNASNTEKLEKAHRIVEAMAVAEGRREVVSGKPPAAGRNASDARAAAVASAAPPVISGGVGGRGTATPEIDFERMRPGDWSKLSRAEKIAALGGEEAL